MIPVFGIISLFVLIGSLGVLFLHYRLLLKRGILDDGLKRLDELLRIRLEIIYEIAEDLEDGSEIKEQCIEYSGKRARETIKALPRIHKAIAAAIHDSTDDDSPSTEIKEALAENAQEIKQATEGYNNALVKYNAYVNKSPGQIIALMVGLKPEKAISTEINF
ncbi:MAG: hypothetical protein FWB91_12965 [Defluviitaleaceae bacterium]|nr:hypothetical protein [Defluviitaleaceae bacterium]